MKKILFLTGTRADFGKIKPLIAVLEKHVDFEPYVFVTGMHLLKEYGYTVLEVQRCGFQNVLTFENYTGESSMDLTLAKTIEGFSKYVKQCLPDMIVVHGDRVEALAGAIVGSLNNILVSHIEGGELSGTVDELIRHSVSKLSHVHFVSNLAARKRLIQMGEVPDSIFEIGSPDIDMMFSDDLPSLAQVCNYYDIEFNSFAIVLFHPVTTESSKMRGYAENFVKALLADSRNYIVIYPNNDLGSRAIIKNFTLLKENSRFRIFPSLRFEYFLVLLKNSQFIIGNSSAGIREAPYYGIPTINIGTRQNNRSGNAEILNVGYDFEDIVSALRSVDMSKQRVPVRDFGVGNSADLFRQSLKNDLLWEIPHQKQFNDSE